MAALTLWAHRTVAERATKQTAIGEAVSRDFLLRLSGLYALHVLKKRSGNEWLVFPRKYLAGAFEADETAVKGF